MEYDSFLVGVGTALLAFGVLAWGVCLLRPRAMLFDAVSLSWVAFIIWIALGVLGVGLLEPLPEPFGRYTEGTTKAVGLIVLGLGGYLLGLAWRRGHVLVTRLIPVPRDNLSVPVIWCLLFLSAIVYLVTLSFAPANMSLEILPIVGAISISSLSAVGVLSILLIIKFRGAFLSHAVALCLVVAVMAVFLTTEFSRRPVPSLLGAMVALFYHSRMRRKPMLFRAFYLSCAALAIGFVIVYLTATRGRTKDLPTNELISEANRSSLLGGVTINIQVLEFAAATYPNDYPYLYGSGMLPLIVWPIPRAVWPNKPLPSGGVISRQYLGKDNESIACTVIGESFINFGWFGPPLVLLAAGVIVGGVNRTLIENADNATLWTAWAIVIPDYMSEWRGDLTSMTVQGFLRIAFFFAMVWFVGKLTQQRSVAADFGYFEKKRSGARILGTEKLQSK